VSFIVVIAVFSVFFLGMVLVIQGFVGKDPELPEARLLLPPVDVERRDREHPPERHPIRLVVIGVGLMALAVVLGIILS
jgi:hypothetical protein